MSEIKIKKVCDELIRTVIWFIYFSLYLLVITPGIGKAKRLHKKNKAEADDYVAGIAVKWGRRLVKLAGGKVETRGLENIPRDEAVLFVSNHQGNFDIPILLHTAERKIGFLSKVEVKKIPLISVWMELLDCVFIDRKDRRKSVKAIREAAGKLVEGNSLVVFPEGTRSKGAELSEFKLGSLKLATLSKAVIIPVTIDGSYKLMEANNGKMRPAHVKVTYGKPIRSHQIENINLQLLAEEIQAEIKQTLTS